MYGLMELLVFPDSQTPELQRIELFDSFDEAKRCSEELMQIFFEKYGEDYRKQATEQDPIAEATNGETDWFAYIGIVNLKSEYIKIEMVLNILKDERRREKEHLIKNGICRRYQYVDRDKLVTWSQLPSELIDEVICYFQLINDYIGIKKVFERIEKNELYDKEKDQFYMAALFDERANLGKNIVSDSYSKILKNNDVKIVLREYYRFLVEQIEQMLKKGYSFQLIQKFFDISDFRGEVFQAMKTFLAITI